MKAYRKLRDELKRRYSDYSVSIVRAKIKEHAFTCKKGKGWLIKIDNTADEPTAIDALIHEFAHVLSWSEWELAIEHGPLFGIKWAECYKVYEETVC